MFVPEVLLVQLARDQVTMGQLVFCYVSLTKLSNMILHKIEHDTIYFFTKRKYAYNLCSRTHDHIDVHKVKR